MARTHQPDQAVFGSVVSEDLDPREQDTASAMRKSAIASDYKQLAIDRSKPGLWTVTFSNPPINLLEPATIVELQALVSELEVESSLKVVDCRHRTQAPDQSESVQTRRAWHQKQHHSRDQECGFFGVIHVKPQSPRSARLSIFAPGPRRVFTSARSPPA